MEKARLQHLKKLQQRRVRFQGKRTVVNEPTENANNNSNEGLTRHTRHQSYNSFNAHPKDTRSTQHGNPTIHLQNPGPHNSTQIDTNCDNRNPTAPSSGHIHPYYQRFNSSSCQPAYYVPGYPVAMPTNAAPFFYMTPNGRMPIFPQQRLRNFLCSESVIANSKDNQEMNNEDENDDVFASGTSNIPCHLQELHNSRKRAHSAGDMGLLRCNQYQFPILNHGDFPSHPNYPNTLHNTEVLEPPTKKPATGSNFCPNGSTIIYQPGYLPTSTIRPPPPPYPTTISDTQRKIPTTSNLSIKHQDVAEQPQARKLNRTPLVVHSKSTVYNPQTNVSTPVETKVCDYKAEKKCRVKQVVEKKQSCSAPHSEVLSQEPSATTSKSSFVKKSILSSKSQPVKKKVVWTDMAAANEPETTKPSKPATYPSNQLNESEIKKVKANPAKHTRKNRIGPFLIGPLLGNSPVKCISQYLVRKEGTGKYFMAKVFTENQKPGETRSGKMLLHTEHSLLSLLSSHPGVIRQYGLFKDTSCNPTSGDVTPRVGLIVDCLVRHEKSVATNNYLNLQQHVIQVKRLSEREALRIFHSVVSVIVSLHKMNVVHRDLKLGNMVLDKRTRKITLINFCLGCHLNSERDLLTDQLGCPAYISPDVLSDKPYAGKPSDMWSLGVVLYTMLYGQFPFYDQAPKKLFAKIKTAEYSIPSSGQASANTNDVIHGLLTLNPLKRLTAVEALDSIESCAAAWYVLRTPTTPAQVVPDVDDLDVSLIERSKLNEESVKQRDKLLTFAFCKKLLSDDENDDEAQISTTKLKLKNPGCSKRPPTLPEICHVSYDARPLSHDEARLHRRLLPNSTGSTNHSVPAH
uniref:uncharacterized protein LOC100186101 n=1 Tax=Ciona intestinalis TaxID=7719 RepID=UPI00089DD336|nr:uncharacterized protein LOC100186101 [Ciona intestinalis]|eukprot:XP_018669573.1 uncharacterized protein LOC100186101 [Ciona intestinalis]